eukprot:gene17497-17694_t
MHLDETTGVNFMSFDNLKLKTKTLFPLILMALVVVGMVAFSAVKLGSISGTANEIITKRDKGISFLIRGSRRMQEVAYNTFGMLAYDNDSDAGKAAVEGFPYAIKTANEFVDQAIMLMPDKAADIKGFKDRFNLLADEAQVPFKMAKDLPGIEHGSTLKPDELDGMARSAQMVAKIDLKSRALIADMENASAASALNAESAAALYQLGGLGLVATLLAGAFSVWISSAKIASPLAQLASRMRALATGDLTVVVDGQTRGDEVGDMAKAVQVFKDNALHQIKLEQQAVHDRNSAEAVQARATQERLRAADEQATVVNRLGEGLQALANGDLTVQLNEGFSETYAQIRADFNAATDKLRETIQLVVASTQTIQGGTQEISTASNDLARRTEQQAASLEETAAALEQVTTTVKKSAEGAKNALRVSVTADNDAKKGAVVVRQTVDAMDSIANSETEVLSGLIAQFQVGNKGASHSYSARSSSASATGNANLRQELKKAAPHAFRQEALPPKRNAALAPGKKVANGAEMNDWKDF